MRRRSALLGGVVGGVLFSAAQVAYVTLTLGAKSRMDEAFAASAWVVIFLIWVYIAWAVVLLGAEVAYAHQTLSLYRREVQGKVAGTAARETIGLAIALCCARAFQQREQPWHPDALSDTLDVPLRTVRDVLRSLEQAEIVAPCDGEFLGLPDGEARRAGARLGRTPRLQAEQQSIYQQFQMVQELRRQAMQQARQPEQVSRPATTPQNYDDMVREQQAQQDRQQRYQYEADWLYERYRELEEQKKPLLERLNELAQER